MPFTRPDLNTLIARAQADMRGRLPDTRPQLRRSLTGIVAGCRAAWRTACTAILTGLPISSCRIPPMRSTLNAGLPYGASTARPRAMPDGPLTVTGAEGSSLPEGTAYQREDGVTYTTREEILIGPEGPRRRHRTGRRGGNFRQRPGPEPCFPSCRRFPAST